MSKAIVVGSINMDIVAFVERQPKVGETVFGREVNYFPGGKGSNQAVACRRLGCETLMVGCLGDDAFGDRLLAFQQQEGLDVSGVRRLHDTASGCALITVAANSDNSIVVIPGANAFWEDGFADDLAVEAGDVVLAQFEIPDRAILGAFKKAKACGALTILNPAPVREISRDIRELTDLLVVNEHELEILAGGAVNIDDDDMVFAAIERLVDVGFASVIATLGDRGVRLLHGGLRQSVAARPVTAVDSTAAGDTFIGGVAAGLLAGLAMMEAVAFGNLAAAISVTRLGAASSIPTLEEVKRWNEKDEPFSAL